MFKKARVIECTIQTQSQIRIMLSITVVSLHMGSRTYFLRFGFSEMLLAVLLNKLIENVVLSVNVPRRKTNPTLLRRVHVANTPMQYARFSTRVCALSIGDHKSQKYPPKCSVRNLSTLLGTFSFCWGSTFSILGVEKYL